MPRERKTSRLGRQARTAGRKSTPRGFQSHRIGRRLQEVEEKEVVAEEVMEAEGVEEAEEVGEEAKEVGKEAEEVGKEAEEVKGEVGGRRS